MTHGPRCAEGLRQSFQTPLDPHWDPKPNSNPARTPYTRRERSERPIRYSAAADYFNTPYSYYLPRLQRSASQLPDAYRPIGRFSCARSCVTTTACSILIGNHVRQQVAPTNGIPIGIPMPVTFDGFTPAEEAKLKDCLKELIRRLEKKPPPPIPEEKRKKMIDRAKNTAHFHKGGPQCDANTAAYAESIGSPEIHICKGPDVYPLTFCKLVCHEIVHSCGSGEFEACVIEDILYPYPGEHNEFKTALRPKFPRRKRRL